MNYFFIWGTLGILVMLLMVGGVWWIGRKDRGHPFAETHQRVLLLYAPQHGHQLLVGVSASRPPHWKQVAKFEEEALWTTRGERIAKDDALALLLLYENGEILDYSGYSLPLPEGVRFLEAAEVQTPHVLDPELLTVGNERIKVSFGMCPARPHDPEYYSTRLTNLSEQSFRVVYFGGYLPQGKHWVLNTVSGTFFTAEQFRNWYGLGRKEWIEPGETVVDPHNYGAPPVIWAYFCETPRGEKFVAGKKLD